MDKKTPRTRDMRTAPPDPVRADPIVSGLMDLEEEILGIVNKIAVIRRDRANAILKGYMERRKESNHGN